MIARAWQQADDSAIYVPCTVDRYGVLTKTGARTARRLLREIAAAKKKAQTA